MLEVQFGGSCLKSELLYTRLYSPRSSYWMYVQGIIYSEHQQQCPLKSLYFRLSKLKINFSLAFALCIQQRLLVT